MDGLNQTNKKKMLFEIIIRDKKEKQNKRFIRHIHSLYYFHLMRLNFSIKFFVDHLIHLQYSLKDNINSMLIVDHSVHLDDEQLREFYLL